MIQNTFIGRLFISAVVAVGLLGCNGEKQNIDNDVTVSGNETPKISIKIQSPSLDNVLVTRALGTTIVAEPDEAAINKLNVYIFKKTGHNGNEFDYTFFKEYSFDASNLTDGGASAKLCSVDIEPEIMNQTVRAAIVANDEPTSVALSASTTLAAFREALATATVATGNTADDLVGGTNKSFPMSCVTDDINTTPNGNSVDATLVRSMARIDILNLAKDLYITSVKLTNVNTKSCLLGQAEDGELNIPSTGTMQKMELKPLTKYSAKLTGAGLGYDATHDTEGTEAIRKANKHRVFYLYEQEVKDETSSPKVTIEYIAKNAKKEKNGKIEVVFKKTKDWVNVKRNHIYTIQLGEEGKTILKDKMKVSFIVNDWNEVTVPSEIHTDRYATIAVGDFMLKDGTTVKPDALKSEQQQNVIGVVAYLYKTEKNARLKEDVKNALKAKGVAAPHGLVMSLKNAANKVAWRTSNTPFGELKGTLKEMYDEGADGYTLTTNVWNDNNHDEFPAFKVTKEYGTTVKAPVNTTGWYIPSAGEWIDIFGDKGFQVNKTDQVIDSYASSIYFIRVAPTAISILNQKIDKVGQGNFDAFALNQYYWSSSENSSDGAYSVAFRNNEDLDFGYGYFWRTNLIYVRPILAF